MLKTGMNGRWSKSTIILWFCGATLVSVHLHQKLSDVQFLPSFCTHREKVKQYHRQPKNIDDV